MSEEKSSVNEFYALGFKDYQYFGRPQIQESKVSDEEFASYMKGWKAAEDKYNE